MSEENEWTEPVVDDDDDFDFVDHYGAEIDTKSEDQLPDNTAKSALNCAFVGFGGGGGKMAKAFLDLGFNKTVLINTTAKDQPEEMDPKHLVLIPDADGVGKDVDLGKAILKDNSTVVEDALKNKLGNIDWLFVLASGGGGTGSSCVALHDVFERYLKSVQAKGSIVYIVSWPSAQELLNHTIAKNALALANDVAGHAHIMLDNERQLKLLRGKVGILGMYPTANKTFAKLFWQILKLASEESPVQTFDSKDLENCLRTNKRIFVGTTVIPDPKLTNLGATIYQNCSKRSPCEPPRGKSSTGTMLLVATPEMANDPEISKHLDAAISYVGGRTDTLFSGVYVRNKLPGLIAILIMSGLDK
jgi:cell division GTPase FtsZ